MRLAHLSDPHLGPLPRARLSELASKRAIGWINWQRKRARQMMPEVLERLIEDLRAQAPDHIAVTGDLVNLALDAEFAPAATFLARLGEPCNVSLVPGNHDAYVPGALKRAGPHWIEYMQGDPSETGDPAAVGHAIYPFVRVRPPLAIIGVSSARPSAPFLATGHVGTRQALLLREHLEHLGRAGLFRVVLIHHPPVRGSTAWPARLVGGSRVRAAIQAAGAELVLHGHTHQPDRRILAGPNGPVPVIGVPSASQAPNYAGERLTPARYNLFDIDGSPGAWRCEMIERGYVKGGDAIVEIARRSAIDRG